MKCPACGKTDLRGEWITVFGVSSRTGRPLTDPLSDPGCDPIAPLAVIVCVKCDHTGAAFLFRDGGPTDADRAAVRAEVGRLAAACRAAPGESWGELARDLERAARGEMPTVAADAGPGRLDDGFGAPLLTARKWDRITYQSPGSSFGPETAIVETAIVTGTGWDRGERVLYLDNGQWARNRWIIRNHGRVKPAERPAPPA
jgi:hypothetical protein